MSEGTKVALSLFLFITVVILLFIGLSALLFIIIGKLGPVYVAQQTGRADFKFSYLGSEEMPFYLLMLIIPFYLVPIGILVSFLVMGLFGYLEKRFPWSQQNEFPDYRQLQQELQQLLKKASVIAIILLFVFIYANIDTYLLLEEKGVTYNVPFLFNQKYYDWSEVTGILQFQYSSPSLDHTYYYLVLSDGNRLKIDNEGSWFVQEKTGLVRSYESFYCNYCSGI